MTVKKIKYKILAGMGLESYTDFCKNVGISRHNFSKWINNHQKLSVSTLYKLLNYLEVLPPEHNFLSIEKLTVDQFIDLYENRDKLEEVFNSLERLDKKYKLNKIYRDIEKQ